MKKLVIAFVALLSLSALASEGVQIPEGAQYISYTSGDLVSAKPLCPKGAMCIVNGTKIELAINLGGCVDLVGPVSYKISQQKDETQVFVAATRMATKASMVVKCAKPATSPLTLTLVNVYGNIKIHFIGTDEVIDVAAK